MRLHTLRPARGSVRKNRRLGRGQGSGGGGTAGRGHKGAQSRSGYSRKAGFEGGQMPLQRRIPKFGFKNNNKIVFKAINLDVLEELSKKTKAADIDIKVLTENGMIGNKDRVKVLGRGELKSKLNVHAHAFSVSAMKAIEAAGGTANKIG